MTTRTVNAFKIGGFIFLVLAVVGICAAAMPRVKDWWKPKEGSGGQSDAGAPAVGWSKDDPNALRLPPEAVAGLGVRTAEVRKADRPRPLELPGSLGPNTDRLLPVRARFPGEVVEIAPAPDTSAGGPTRFRPVQTGDEVHAGQLLAVVWSKDLGLQKSALVDAVSKQRLDQDRLDRLQKLYQQQSVSEITLRSAERDVEQDRIAVAAAERVLRSWRLTDKEIRAVYGEANRIARKDGKEGRADAARDHDQSWARVEVWAPFDGTILEKNVAPGAIVDTSTNLFMLGDLRQLSVVAYPYEEDLPALLALPRPIHWTIRLGNDPNARPLRGTVSEIRPLIDPTMHTGLIKGMVANPEGRLVQGQFVTVTIDRPPARDEVEVPVAALVEDGQDSVVFVQAGAREPLYRMRRVAVVRRTRDSVYVRSRLTATQKEQGLAPLEAGERVVTVGALQMKAALEDAQQAKAGK